MSDLPNHNPNALVDPQGVSFLRYGAVVFPTETEVVEVSCTPNYDEAGRTVISVTFRLTVKAWLTLQGQDSIDNLTLSVRRNLTHSGQPLYFQGRGFGNDFLINVNGTANSEGKNVRDVAWGPKPDILQWKPKGCSPSAAEVVWSVQTTFPDCDSAVYQGNVLEWNYRLSYTVDAGGYTTRVHDGFVRVPQSKKDPSSTTLSDHADRLRDLVRPPVPEGFRRLPQVWTLSADKCRLGYTITDEQLPGPPPPKDVVFADASHEITSDQTAMSRWTGSLSASYEVSAGRERALAAGAFADLLNERTGRAERRAVGRLLLPTHYSITEPEIYGRKHARFSVKYRYNLRIQDIGALLSSSGLWRQVEADDWNVWSQSMDFFNWGTRGHAQLQFNPADDAIVDLCLNPPVRKPSPAAARPRPGGGAARPPPPGLTPKLGLAGRGGGVGGAGDERVGDPLVRRMLAPFLGQDFDTDDGYLNYVCFLRVEPLDETPELKPLPAQAVEYTPGKQGDGYSVPYAPGPTSLVQFRARPSVYVSLVGHAIRAGKMANAPELLKVGGQRPLPCNVPGENYFESAVVGDLLVAPLVLTRWNLRWLVPAVPDRPLGPPANPLYGRVQGAPAGLKQAMGFALEPRLKGG